MILQSTRGWRWLPHDHNGPQPDLGQRPLLKRLSASLLTLLMGLFFQWGCLSQLQAATQGATLDTAEDAKRSDSSAPLKQVRLRLNWHHQFQFAGFYAAQMQGYYRDRGLQVDIQDWQPEVTPVAAIEQDQTDFAVGYSTLVAHYAAGAPIRLVMSAFQYSPMVLLSHQPVHDLSQLGGKVIAHQENMQVINLIRQIESSADRPVVEVPASGHLQDFIDKKVDLYAAYMTNEPYRLDQKGVAYSIIDPKSYGSQSYGDMLVVKASLAQQQPGLVQAFREATIEGWRYALAHPEAVVDAMMARYPTVKGRRALLSEARLTEQYVRAGHTPIGDVDLSKLQATAASARDSGLLTTDQYQQTDWQGFLFSGVSLSLTPQEQAFLAKHPVIKIGNDIDWKPFEFTDARGRYRGIAADYLALFEQKLGVRFEPVKNQRWSEVVAMAESGQLDMYSCAVATPERQAYMDFTQPYLSFPMVLVGLKDMSYVQDYQQLAGQKVAVVKDYWSHEALKQNYPAIDLLVVDSVKAGLEAVIAGRALAYSGNLGAINFAINTHGLTGVHVIGQSKQRFELAFGVRQDRPLLFSVINKALQSVTPAERQAIYNRWIQLRVVNQLDQSQLWQVALSAGGVGVFLISILLVYRFQKARQQAYIDQIHELTYASLIDLETMHLLKTSDAFARLTGYSRSELLQMNYLDLATQQMNQARQQAVIAQLKAGQHWRGEVQGRKKNGDFYWVELTLSPIKNWMGEVRQVWATRIDITNRKKVERLSIEDDLTGVYNRRFFNHQFEREIHRHVREDNLICVAMLDLDYFKQVNDHFGHQRGDQVLVQVSQLLKQAFSRGGDYIFRMGGEEFLVITSVASAEVFYQHCCGLLDAIDQAQIENPKAPLGYLTVSVGAVCYAPTQSMQAEALYHQADEQLYLAKQQGRHQVMMETHL